jgi:hypothetical protein
MPMWDVDGAQRLTSLHAMDEVSVSDQPSFPISTGGGFNAGALALQGLCAAGSDLITG